MKNVAVAAALLFAAGLAGAAARDKVTEEVIVEGTRPEVEQRVNTFVKGVTHRGYAVESLVSVRCSAVRRLLGLDAIHPPSHLRTGTMLHRLFESTAIHRPC